MFVMRVVQTEGGGRFVSVRAQALVDDVSGGGRYSLPLAESTALLPSAMMCDVI